MVHSDLTLVGGMQTYVGDLQTYLTTGGGWK